MRTTGMIDKAVFHGAYPFGDHRQHRRVQGLSLGFRLEQAGSRGARGDDRRRAGVRHSPDVQLADAHADAHVHVDPGHPVRRRDYLGAKALVAVGLPFLVLALFILVPWGLSLLVAGARGPLWPTLPLYLLPAALVIATLMGAVALAAGSLASSPKGAFGWALGILLGGPALSGILIGITQEPVWKALSVEALAAAWPGLLCGAGPEAAGLGWLPATAGSVAYLGLCTWIAARRTRPEEATL